MSGFSLNGFVAGDTPATFTDYRVSPVRMIREGTDAEAIEVCSPAGRAFWSIYGDTGAGWRLVHDAEADDARLERFRAWAAQHTPRGYRCRQWRDLPPESFASVGVRINTVVLTLQKC